MKVNAVSLLAQCKAARQEGIDFPRIWHEILKKHPLVQGMPEQGGDKDNPALEISLLGGRRLIFDAAGDFSLS